MKFPKEKEIKDAYYKAGMFWWSPCPHCKKMLIFQPKEDKAGRRALKEWKKLKKSKRK